MFGNDDFIAPIDDVGDVGLIKWIDDCLFVSASCSKAVSSFVFSRFYVPRFATGGRFRDDEWSLTDLLELDDLELLLLLLPLLLL